MANYLYCLTTEATLKTVGLLFGTQSSFSPIGNLFQLDGGRDFKGYHIDHERRIIAFEDAERTCWPSVDSPMEGCYIRREIVGRMINIGSDLFHQVPILYFCEADTFAASDSLFLLTELRKHLGLSCSIDEEAALGRAFLGQIAVQLLNGSTSVLGVRSCPLGHWLAVDAHSRQPTAFAHQTPARRLLSSDLTSHAETISEAADRMVGLVAAIVQHPQIHVGLSLSGGFDSRACLAAIVRAGCIGKVRITSDPKSDKDFWAATNMALHVGFEINQSRRLRRRRSVLRADEAGPPRVPAWPPSLSSTPESMTIYT